MMVATALLLLMGMAQEAGVQESRPSPPAGSWLAVSTLTTRDEVRVEMVTGESRRGRFLAATDDSLSLMLHGTTVRCERDRIRNVYRLVPRSRQKHVIAGALIGAGLGVLSGSFADTPSGANRGAWVAGAIAVDAGLGGLIGAGVAGPGEFLLIYHAGP